MLLVAVFAATSLIGLLAAVAFQRHRARHCTEREAVVLFETRSERPYTRPIFTAKSSTLLHVEAPVVHARLASDILFLDIQTENGGEPMGLELAITGVPLSWLKGERYEYIKPTAQILIGPRGQATERLMRRVSEAHDIDLPITAGQHVHAYELSSVICDPAEDTLRFEAALPSGQVLRINYDYAGASVSGSLPVAALGEAANAQPLGIRIAA